MGSWCNTSTTLILSVPLLLLSALFADRFYAVIPYNDPSPPPTNNTTAPHSLHHPNHTKTFLSLDHPMASNLSESGGSPLSVEPGVAISSPLTSNLSESEPPPIKTHEGVLFPPPTKREKQDGFQRVQAQLASARASIKRDAKFCNNSCYGDDSFVPKGVVYRNPGAFYR
ncbi:hypothetical protein AMTR_s00046p00173100 [Amborella trichopoda]|uniref:Uncharacterized protein n=1 Tax=Amborella trichopoda TaxID=13333 RepID=U5D6H3_AMBTC|nr:hypothetical protein AMTR_s00046p00173100 [Amborella trichopoda]